MSLIGFHRFLIVAAILFCLGFAGWEFKAAADGAGGPAAVLGGVFTFLGASFIFYLSRLARFLGYEE